MSLSRDVVSTYLLIGAVLLLPYVTLPQIPNGYEAPKFLFFLGAVFSLTLFTYITQILQKKKERVTVNMTYFFLVGIFTLYVFVADIFGLDIRTSFLGSDWRLQGFLLSFGNFLLFFLLQTVHTKTIEKCKEVFIVGAVISAVIIACIGISQFVSYHFFYNFHITLYQGRILSVFGNPNFLGGYLAAILPFVLSQNIIFKRMPSFGFFIVRICSVVLILVCIFLSGSRSGILAASIVLCFVFYQNKFFLKRYFIQVLLIVTLCIVLFLSLWRPFYETLVENRFSYWENRSLIWVEGVKAVARNPIFGYGQENFELIYPKDRYVKIDSAHNIFLEIAVSAGIPGLLLFIAICYYALKHAPFLYRLSLIAFLIVAQFNPLSIAQICLFWLLLGIVREKKGRIVS